MERGRSRERGRGEEREAGVEREGRRERGRSREGGRGETDTLFDSIQIKHWKKCCQTPSPSIERVGCTYYHNPQ